MFFKHDIFLAHIKEQ